MLATLAWFGMVLWMQPDLLLHENVPKWPFELMQFFLGGFYTFQRHDLNPAMICNFGVSRPRCYSLGKRAGWGAILEMKVPLPTAMQDNLVPFEVLTDTNFFVANIPDDVKKTYFVLSAKIQKTLKENAKKHPTRDVFPLECSSDWCSGTDSGFLSTFKKNSTRRWSQTHQRWLIAAERLLAHGLPITPWAAHALGVDERPALRHMPLTAQHKAAGNGMHMIPILAMMGYALSCGATVAEQMD